MAAKKDDPTVTSQQSAASNRSAPPTDQAADYAGGKQYTDNPEKEADAVAQLEVRPDEQ